MDELEIISRLKESDKAAFEHLYQCYWPKVYNFTKLYITSSEEVEEVVQEVFIKLWEVRSSLDTRKNFSGFLFIITRNIIFNQFRRSFNDAFYKMTALETLEGTYDIENELEASDLSEYIERLLKMLPTRQQEVFYLSRKEHLTYKEIATRLQVTEKVVEHSISDVLMFLRKNLKLYIVFLLINASYSWPGDTHVHPTKQKHPSYEVNKLLSRDK